MIWIAKRHVYNHFTLATHTKQLKAPLTHINAQKGENHGKGNGVK